MKPSLNLIWSRSSLNSHNHITTFQKRYVCTACSICAFKCTYDSLHADCTCMDGPVSEERSIFLHVPAMSRSMHPWNLEYSLLLQAKNMQNVSQAKTHPKSTAFVHAVTFTWQNNFTNNSILLTASVVSTKQCCKKTSLNNHSHSTLLTHLSPGILQEFICSSNHGLIRILSTGMLT